MSNPPNPLDKFVTYTTHYELHAAASIEALIKSSSSDSANLNSGGLSTTRKNGNGTLLINTRKDAHQVIDNIRYKSENGAGGLGSASLHIAQALTLTITEHGGIDFTEKLINQQKKYGIQNIQGSMIFGLKIFFVCRDSNNTITTIPSSMIFLNLNSLTGNFDHRGGYYNASFHCSATVAAPTMLDLNSKMTRLIGFVNKDLTINAKTVKTAMEELEKVLNSNYDKTYSTVLENCAKSKSIKYKIKLDPKFDGDLDIINSETNSPDSDKKLSFSSSMSIVEMINIILKSSKATNTLIAKSAKGLEKPLHPDVCLPLIIPRYYVKEDEVEIGFDIKQYTGQGDKIEFDFIFAEAGKNVDIISFDIKFTNILVWIEHKSTLGTDKNTDQSTTVRKEDPSYFYHNVLTEDRTRDLIKDLAVERFCIPADKGDVAFLPINSDINKNTTSHVPSTALEPFRFAFDTITNATSASNVQFNFTIRGNLDILNLNNLNPDGTITDLFIKGLWLKINIKNQDGEPYYYTGYYRVIAIEHVFEQGKFTQNITVIMMTEEEQKDVNPVVNNIKIPVPENANLTAITNYQAPNIAQKGINSGLAIIANTTSTSIESVSNVVSNGTDTARTIGTAITNKGIDIFTDITKKLNQ